jgi:hypothetical protein
MLPGVVRNCDSVRPEVDIRSLSVKAESLDVQGSLVQQEDISIHEVSGVGELAKVPGRLRGHSGWGGGLFMVHHHHVLHVVHYHVRFAMSHDMGLGRVVDRMNWVGRAVSWVDRLDRMDWVGRVSLVVHRAMDGMGCRGVAMRMVHVRLVAIVDWGGGGVVWLVGLVGTIGHVMRGDWVGCGLVSVGRGSGLVVTMMLGIHGGMVGWASRAVIGRFLKCGQRTRSKENQGGWYLT